MVAKEWREWGSVMGTGLPLGDENVLELDSDDDCTNFSTY